MADGGVLLDPLQPVAAENHSGTSRISAVVRSSTQQPQCLTWSRVPVYGSVVPPPRSGAASVVVNGRLYCFGGFGGNTERLDDFYSFCFATQTWEEVPVRSQVKPGRRENNGAVISDNADRIYIFGGYSGNTWLNDLWVFDIGSAEWKCIQESSDPEDNAGSLLEDSLPHPVLAAGDPSSAVRGVPPSRRFGFVSVVHEGKFIVFGGFDGRRWLNDMHEFCFATNTWTAIVPKGAIPSARSCPAWAKETNILYTVGGYDGNERKADFFACDLSTYTWTEMLNLGTPPSPRYFHSCCLYGNKMYLYGGFSGSERLSDMYVYCFDSNHWTQIMATGGDAPSGRSSLVAQIYENSLYVVFGYNGVNVLNDFYRFRLIPIESPPPALVMDLTKLINNSDLSDVHFIVEGNDVYAHKAILSVRSEYFRVMLCGGKFREGTGSSGSADDAPIELPDVTHGVFMNVLEYLYTDKLKKVSLDMSIQLLIASELFMLDRLKSLCEDLIRRDICVVTVISILVAAHRHNASGLKDLALEFILAHLNDPVVMTGLSDLKAEPDLLLEIIKRKTAAPAASVHTTGGGQPSQDAIGPFGGAIEWNFRR